MQCTGVIRNGERAGERCSKKALYGASVCLSHGGSLPNVRAKAEVIVEAARLRLMDAAPEAAEYLVDLAANSASDAVRLGAAKEILDRAGVKAGQDINLKVTNGADPAAVLQERLAHLASRVVEGELVDSPPEDGTVQSEADELPLQLPEEE